MLYMVLYIHPVYGPELCHPAFLFMANQKLASFVGVKDPYHDWGCFVEPIYDNI